LAIQAEQAKFSQMYVGLQHFICTKLETL